MSHCSVIKPHNKIKLNWKGGIAISIFKENHHTHKGTFGCNGAHTARRRGLRIEYQSYKLDITR